MTDRTVDRALEEGRAALARGAWEEALVALERAVADDPADGLGWECLAYARTWVQNVPAAIDARQRSYAVYREQGQDLSAARVSLDLVYDFIEVRGEPAVANGWLRRARRLLQDEATAPEHAVLRVWDAYMAMDSDVAAAERHARQAVEIAHACGAHDVGTLALAVHGLALVSEGRVPDGMGLLDEALAGAVGREITDPQWYYFACCCMIDACDRVRDFERSLAWCDQLRDFATRWRVPAFLTTCRVKYTSALLWRGDWQECEAHLEHAVAELASSRRVALPGAVVRLAELRRRQGRISEAEALLEGAGAHPHALHVRAALEIDRGRPDVARELLERLLQRADRNPGSERIAALEALARVLSTAGELDRARSVAAELETIAGIIRTDAVRASALVAAALVSAGEADHERARDIFQEAADLFETRGSRYETARVRLDLARCVSALGRHSAAVLEATTALTVFEALGAVPDADRARALLGELQAAQPQPVNPAGRRADALLTRRQREVLALIAQGMSDAAIAQSLVLSEHTVHRHVANILTRLGVTSRTAAVAKALRSGLL